MHDAHTDVAGLRATAHDLATTDLARTDEQAHDRAIALADLGRRIAEAQATPTHRATSILGASRYRRIGAVAHTATRTLRRPSQNAADHVTVTCPPQVVPLLSDGAHLHWTLHGTISAYDMPNLYCGVRFGDTAAHDSAQIGRPDQIGMHAYHYDIAERIGTGSAENRYGHRLYSAFILDPGYSVLGHGDDWRLTQPADGHPLLITHAGSGMDNGSPIHVYEVTYQGHSRGQIRVPVVGYPGSEQRAAEALVFGDGGIAR